MDFEDYQDRAQQTAIYPGAGLGSPEAIDYTILGLVGEAGELANVWKKYHRDGERDADGNISHVSLVYFREKLRDELGDVLWYVANLATELGLDLSGLAEENLKKLESRQQRGTLKGSGDTR